MTDDEKRKEITELANKLTDDEIRLCLEFIRVLKEEKKQTNE